MSLDSDVLGSGVETSSGLVALTAVVTREREKEGGGAREREAAAAQTVGCRRGEDRMSRPPRAWWR